MKIFISHSRGFDFQNELYEPLKNPAFAEHTFFFPHQNNEDINSKKEIESCNLLLAEVSFPSTGQGIELGWANDLSITILCISKENNKVSDSLKYISNNFMTYSGPEDLVSKLLSFLKK